MIGDLSVNGCGEVLVLTVKDSKKNIVPLVTADKKEITFYKPSKQAFVRDLLFLTDGNDGKLKYIFLDGDRNEIGDWRYQVFLEFPATEQFPIKRFYSNIRHFRVRGNLQS